MKPNTLLAYHFTDDTLRGGRPLPKINTWLSHEGPIVPCRSGLHASVHPYAALTYAPGSRLHLVKLKGDIQHHSDDKVVGRHRKIIKSLDAEGLLREFARWNALQVIHFWKAPPVVKQYLETGDESLRTAAWYAAQAATWAAARAARSATWAAAQVAARAATWAATGYAAWAAARAAAWYAAADAAEGSHTAKAREKFQQMVNKAFESTP